MANPTLAPGPGSLYSLHLPPSTSNLVAAAHSDAHTQQGFDPDATPTADPHQTPNQLLRICSTLVTPEADDPPFIPTHNHNHDSHPFVFSPTEFSSPHLASHWPDESSTAPGIPSYVSAGLDSMALDGQDEFEKDGLQRKRPRLGADRDGNSIADDASYLSQIGTFVYTRGAGSPKPPDEPVMGTGRVPGACRYCKKLKIKCDFSSDWSKRLIVCRRCWSDGELCIVERRKPRRAHINREFLSILTPSKDGKDAIIESQRK